jgi:hypothetical protein
MKISIAINVALSAFLLWLWTTPYGTSTMLFTSGVNCGMALAATVMHVVLVTWR